MAVAGQTLMPFPVTAVSGDAAATISGSIARSRGARQVLEQTPASSRPIARARATTRSWRDRRAGSSPATRSDSASWWPTATICTKPPAMASAYDGATLPPAVSDRGLNRQGGGQHQRHGQRHGVARSPAPLTGPVANAGMHQQIRHDSGHQPPGEAGHPLVQPLPADRRQDEERREQQHRFARTEQQSRQAHCDVPGRRSRCRTAAWRRQAHAARRSERRCTRPARSRPARGPAKTPPATARAPTTWYRTAGAQRSAAPAGCSG